MVPAALRNTSQNAARLVLQQFRQQFGEPHSIYRAPGRVNLIGEHTDYNEGFVMPAALAFYTFVAVGPRSDDKLYVQSIDFNECRQFDLSSVMPGSTGHWSDYVRGVAGVMRARNIPLPGANLVIKGNVPIGAGLSSSAAIEVSTAFALLGVAGTTLNRLDIACLCQRAEHDFAGTKCGIMDQFISCCGEANHALLLDCRSLHFESLAVPESVRIVICNTMVRHELAAGEYNRRRADCETGVQLLRQSLLQIRTLRDVSLAQLEEYGGILPETVRHRCHHVISENERALRAAAALKQSDLEEFGKLMAESHASLREDYEVSCLELDLLVELALKCRGVYGARMTGGGFGGCTVNLVDKSFVNEFESTVSQGYKQATGVRPEIYVCTAADGAREIDKESA